MKTLRNGFFRLIITVSLSLKLTILNTHPNSLVYSLFIHQLIFEAHLSPESFIHLRISFLISCSVVHRSKCSARDYGPSGVCNFQTLFDFIYKYFLQRTLRFFSLPAIKVLLNLPQTLFFFFFFSFCHFLPLLADSASFSITAWLQVQIMSEVYAFL